jgi:hypothetical protein
MSGASAEAPSSLGRLFAHYRELPTGDDARPFLIGRLLEEGEQGDLRWLTRQVAEDDLAAWFRAAGSRQLSRRSRAFWSTILGVEAPTDPGDDLWPL